VPLPVAPPARRIRPPRYLKPAPRPRYGRRWLGGMILGILLVAGTWFSLWAPGLILGMTCGAYLCFRPPRDSQPVCRPKYGRRWLGGMIVGILLATGTWFSLWAAGLVP
jgi:hypothetical protein